MFAMNYVINGNIASQKPFSQIIQHAEKVATNGTTEARDSEAREIENKRAKMSVSRTKRINTLKCESGVLQTPPSKQTNFEKASQNDDESSFFD